MASLRNYPIALGDYCLAVEYYHDEVHDLLDFLFRHNKHSIEQYDVGAFKIDRFGDAWSLHFNNQHLLNKTRLDDIAVHLMGEVIERLITNNKTQLALHAAYLSDEHGGILLPGESGAGKTSMTFWMAAHGFHFHTDEMVLIDPSTLQAEAFARPFNIKSHGLAPISQFYDFDAQQQHIRTSQSVTLVPHECVNAQSARATPDLNRIIYPRYSADALNRVCHLSKAEAGIELMKSNVIARNLPGHGFQQLLSIVKKIPAYRIEYNHFDKLPQLLAQTLAQTADV